MMSGVTIGEIIRPIASRRAGMSGLDQSEGGEGAEDRRERRRRDADEQAVGERAPPGVVAEDLPVPSGGTRRPDRGRSIPSVNVKYGSALKLRGTMTRMGAIRKVKISAHAVRWTIRPMRCPGSAAVMFIPAPWLQAAHPVEGR